MKSETANKRLSRLGLEGPLPLLLACMVGSVTSSSYNNMVSVALPSIGQSFQVDITIVQWVILAYLLTNSSTIAISGRLGDLFGPRRIYRLGLAIFAFGGIACALAPSFLALLVVRPIQALGTGMFVVSLPAILTEAFPDRQRGRVLGLYATAVFVGLAVGPLLGGLLTEVFGWRGVFATTVLVAGVALWLAWRYVPLGASRRRSGSLDLLGSLFYVTTLLPILLALGRSRQWGLDSPLVLGLLGLGLLAAAAFVLVERRAASPMFELRLFRQRYFALSALASIGMFVTYYPVLFLMPFYLVEARGVSPATAGLLLSSLSFSMVLVASPAGVLSDRFGPIVPATFSAVLIGLGLLALTQIGPDTPYPYVVLGLFLVGSGAGFGDVANNSALMGSVPASLRGLASGTVGTTRYVGQSLGVALATAVFAFAAGTEAGPQAWAGFTTAFLVLAGVSVASVAVSAARGKLPKEPARG